MTIAARLKAIPTLGVAPEDDADTRLRKRSATLTAVIAASVVAPWTIFYYSIGLPWVAATPTFYIVLTALSLVHMARTKRDNFVRISQLLCFLFLPPLVHIALGGFVNSSGVVMFSSVVAVGAVSIAGSKRPGVWFAAFAALVALLIPFDSTFREWAPDVPEGVVIGFFATNIVSTALINFLALYTYDRARTRLAQELAVEQARSDELLRNVLPESIADRLKEGERPIADRYDHVAVLFADIVNFTPLSESMSAEDLVTDLNGLFSTFDQLAASYGLEKVKTIGDAYMVVSGAPEPGPGLEQLALLALEMREAGHSSSLGERHGVEMRFGIDVGPLIGGVIGESRFIYDVYGDTVNTASRMESNGIAGQIQITERAAKELNRRFETRERGTIDIKGKGPTTTYILVGEVDSKTPR